MTAVPRLPEGGRLLHIGPHKTGSTTLQAAFHQNRPALADQGVHYAGRNAQPMAAAMAAASGRTLPTLVEGESSPWDRLVEEVDGAPQPRAMISSEFFCEADDDHIRAILDRLGRERTHVVVTLRPLSRILASQWQQYMQNRMVIGYEEWLDAMLRRGDDSTVTPSFWRRHRHDRLVRRWAEVAGADHVTVVVVDESDRLMLVRTFEEMLGLRGGTLRPRNVAANRSLTHPEVEFMRAFNAVYRERGWSEADYTRFVRFGAVRHLQERRPPEDEPRVLTPAWAASRVVEIAHEMTASIATSGVRVVGDLSSLTVGLEPRSVGDNAPVTTVPPEIPARFAAGLVLHLDAVEPQPAPPHRRTGPLEATLRLRRQTTAVTQRLRRTRRRLRGAPPIEELTTGELVRLLGREGTRRALRR